MGAEVHFVKSSILSTKLSGLKNIIYILLWIFNLLNIFNFPVRFIVYANYANYAKYGNYGNVFREFYNIKNEILVVVDEKSAQFRAELW